MPIMSQGQLFSGTRPRGGFRPHEWRKKGWRRRRGQTWSQLREEMGIRGREDESRWVEERELDPFAAITPDPMNFVVETPVTRFLAADPSAEDIAQFERLHREGKWQGMLREFMKWAGTSQGARFDGEEDVAAVVKWDDALQFHFQITGWTNPIACAVAATSTFHGKARSWWRAHFGRRPQLVIGYAQLVEWVKRELVPRADPGTSCVVWADLQFKGDVDNFLKELDQLMTFHPLKHDSMIRMSARPFGAAFVSKAVSADAQFGARADAQFGGAWNELSTASQTHPKPCTGQSTSSAFGKTKRLHRTPAISTQLSPPSARPSAQSGASARGDGSSIAMVRHHPSKHPDPPLHLLPPPPSPDSATVRSPPPIDLPYDPPPWLVSPNWARGLLLVMSVGRTNTRG